MDITLYFMKLEDKYWAVFLASLLILCLLQGKRKACGKWYVTACYGLLAYLAVLCPLTYRLFARLSAQTERYYELGHTWLVILVLPLTFAAVWAYLSERENAKKEKLYLAVGGFLILLVAGKIVSLSPDEASAAGYGIYSQAQTKGYDMILADAAENGFSDDITLWGPFDFMSDSRVYNASFLPVYGKDIADNENAYGEIARTLYQGYTRYEAKDSLIINKDQQLWSIALFMNLYDEAACRYVVIIDPASQGSDVCAQDIFAACKFVYIGQTGDLQIYRYTGKDG